MKRVLVLAVLSLFLLTAYLWAEKPPVIVLCEGENELPVFVFNKLSTDVKGISVEISQKNVPEWLQVERKIHTIDVETGVKGSEHLLLVLTVSDAPENAGALIPFTLKEKNGKTWSFSAHVTVSAKEPVRDILFENYPNPFNPSTTIRYSLRENRHTTLTVFNSLGQEIRTLVDSPQTAGVHTASWDGRNELGQNVSSGVYLYRLRSGGYVKTMKMVLFE
ncbi:T9SS type A sorting domain-containing protein [Candidatus Omnitrophota bacterium]